MGFRTGSYAKVWSVDQTDKGTRVNLSVSSKNKMTGEYETQFSDFVSFYGEAKEKAASLKKGDRIRLGDIDVRNRYVKDQGKTYYYPCCFSFEMADGAQGAPAKIQAKAQQSQPAEYAIDNGDDPF